MDKNKNLASTFNPAKLPRSTTIHQEYEKQPLFSKTLGASMKESEDQTVFAAS